MGLVYKARHTVLNKLLAVKVLRPEVSNDDEIISRFRQEAQSASAIGNQHIIDISDFGTLPDGATYFIMEFLDGIDLSGAIAHPEPLTPARTVHIAKQLCDALGAAHESGIVHRDLKPDNIYLIKRGGDSDFVKVLDFGIAKVGGGTKKLTKAGQIFGTPHYMSPEQCAGTGTDQRTDIYALGVILYEMVCERVPFDADNLMGVLTKHMYEEPVAPHDLPPPVDVPPALEAVILKCLAKQVDVRYQTMAEVYADLEKAARGETPDAVMDAVARSSSTGTETLPRTDPTGRMSVSIGEPEGGLVGAPAKSKLPLAIAGALVGLLVFVAGAAALMGVFDPEVQEPPPPVAIAPEPEPAAELVEADLEGEGSSDTAVVNVTTVPSGVAVYHDDVLLGNTPYEIERPDEGRVTLVLRKPGFEEQVVNIGALTGEQVNIDLVAVAAEPQAEEPRSDRRSARRTMRRQDRAMETAMAQEAAMAVEPPPQMVRTMRTQTEVLDPWGG
ncbi:MAG: serine/threonine protein kinase [Deltaproteobacteria bacterium]|nr:MAG: serine/threonine protein kinase [Deltaproteobacteria bacterium]